MKRWVYLIPILSVLAVVAIFATASVPVQAIEENEVTSIRPGGYYRVYFTVKKPAGMVLGADWEVRVYFYTGLNCYNTSTSSATPGDGWWNPDPSENLWLYTGYWDWRSATYKVGWSSPDEKTWIQGVQIIRYPAENGRQERRYPAPVGENYESKMSEIPVGSDISLRARLALRRLANVSLDEATGMATYRYGGKTYSYPYTVDQYGDVTLSIGEVSASLSQSEGTGEWTLRFDQNIGVHVDNNAPATGKITLPGIIDFSMMTPSGGGGLPLWVIIVAIVVVLVVIVVAIVVVKMKGAGGVSP